MRKNSYKNLGNFSSSVPHIPHNTFSYQKSRWKVQVNVVISQEPKMVCGESNEINGKNCFVSDR